MEVNEYTANDRLKIAVNGVNKGFGLFHFPRRSGHLTLSVTRNVVKNL